MQQVLLPENMIPTRLYLMISREDPDNQHTGRYVDSYNNADGVRILHLRDTVTNGHIYYAMLDHEFYLIPEVAAGGGGAVAAGKPTLNIIKDALDVGPIDIPRDLQDFADLDFFEEGEPVVRITDPSGFIFICKQESLNSFWSSVTQYGNYRHPITRAIMGQPTQTVLRADFTLQKGVARLPSAKEGGGGKKRSQRRTRRKRRSSRRRNRRNNQHGI